MTVVTLPVRRMHDRPPHRRRWILRARMSTVDELVRRQPPAPAIDPSSLVILSSSREVRLGARSIPFTRIEFDLLTFLASHPRQVFTRDQLLERVWGFSRGGPRTVDVHVRRLRAKLPDRPLVLTVRGVGYRLADGANVRIVQLTR